MIDNTYKYISVAVPKTGSISIHLTLGHHNIPEPEIYHQSITNILKAHPECVGYYKFGFVRNPWARILSLYLDFTLKRINQYSALVRHEKPLFSEFANFSDFCIRFPETQWKDDVFLQSQATMLGCTKDSCIVDFVGRFENLENDFLTICKEIGLPHTSLQAHNAGKYDNAEYRSRYTPEARDAIASYYKEDVELFNYEF